MLAEARRLAILEKLRREHAVEVVALSQEFRVSEATVRRDLLRLEGEGLVRRTHGGAVLRRLTPMESPFSERLTLNQAAKVAIGKAAAGLVEQGDTLIIDSGTTTLRLAQSLGGRQGVTIITNDTKVAFELDQTCPGSKVVLTGGELRHQTYSLVGAIAQRALANVRIHKLFLSTVGLTIPDGLTQPDLEQVAVKQAMLAVADTVILLADASKIGVLTTHVFAPIDVLDVLVTDERAPAKFVRELERRGKRVIQAPLPAERAASS